MILSWMLYASAVALLFGVAASGLEGVIRQRGWPVRGIWVVSLLGSILLPLLIAFVVPQQEPLVPLGRLPGTGLPAQFSAPTSLPWLDRVDAAVTGAPSTMELDTWLLAMWGISSLVLASCAALFYRALLRRRREWKAGRIANTDVWISLSTGPAVLGFARPVIVVPDWVLDKGAGDQELIIAHEVEHIRAADPGLLWSTLLIVVALPWNLPLWWQWSRLRQAVEIDCDLRVLARGKDRKAYSRLLVEVCKHGAARHFAVAALAEPASFLERRIRLMLTPTPRRGLTRTAAAALLAATCVAVACGIQQPERGETSAAGAGRSPQQHIDPAVLEYCRNQVVKAHPNLTATVPDSVEVQVWGRGDTILIAGAAEWRNAEGGTGRTGWTCDMIREENGEWRQWHFGLEPA